MITPLEELIATWESLGLLAEDWKDYPHGSQEKFVQWDLLEAQCCLEKAMKRVSSGREIWKEGI